MDIGRVWEGGGGGHMDGGDSGGAGGNDCACHNTGTRTHFEVIEQRLLDRDKKLVFVGGHLGNVIGITVARQRCAHTQLRPRGVRETICTSRLRHVVPMQQLDSGGTVVDAILQG